MLEEEPVLILPLIYGRSDVNQPHLMALTVKQEVAMPLLTFCFY